MSPRMKEGMSGTLAEEAHVGSEAEAEEEVTAEAVKLEQQQI